MIHGRNLTFIISLLVVMSIFVLLVTVKSGQLVQAPERYRPKRPVALDRADSAEAEETVSPSPMRRHARTAALAADQDETGAVTTHHEEEKGGLPPTFTPTECMKGVTLTDPKLKKKCQDGKVAAHYCAFISGEATVASGEGLEKCGQFSAGTFSPEWRESGWRPKQEEDSSCKIADLSKVLQPKTDFIFDNNNIGKVTCHTGKSRYFSRPEAVSLLRHLTVLSTKGKVDGGRGGILFSGDSMMRQLFLRVISYIRGEDVVSEHYFHYDGLYVLRKGSDALIPLADTATKETHSTILNTFYPGYLKSGGRQLTQSEKDDVVVCFLFQWDTKPSAFRKDFLSMPSVPVHVAAFMYWWSKKEPLSTVDPYLKEMDRFLATPAQRHKKYVYVTTPWTAPKTFGGVENPVRVPRNDRLASWVLGGSPPLNGGAQKLLLDYAGVADSKTFTKTVDGIHYMCIWTPKYPEVVNNQKENGRQCSDPMNLAVIQYLFNLLEATE